MAINQVSFPLNITAVLGSNWKNPGCNGLDSGSTVEFQQYSIDTDNVRYSEDGSTTASSDNRIMLRLHTGTGKADHRVSFARPCGGSPTAFGASRSILFEGPNTPYTFKNVFTSVTKVQTTYGYANPWFDTIPSNLGSGMYQSFDAVSPASTHEGTGALQSTTSSTSGAGYVYTGVAGGGSLQSESPSTLNTAFSSPGNIRTVTALKALLPLNNAGEVTVQTVKDVLTSVYGIYGSLYVSGGVTAQNFTDTPSKVTMWNGQKSMGLLTDYQNSQITVGGDKDGGYVMLASISCTGDVSTVFQFYFRKDGVELPFGCRVVTDSNGNANCGVIIGFDTGMSENVITMYGESDAGGGKNCTFTDASMVLYRVS